MKLDSIFQIKQGHQITDEEIYLTEGDIPVITGRNNFKGFWNDKIVDQIDLPCITYPTKANVGNTYIQTENFDANNTAVLIPFPEWRLKIDLEWISFKLRTIFLKIQTSKGGVSYLNKEIVKDLEINIPSLEIQINEKKIISEMFFSRNKIDYILKKIEKFKYTTIVIEYKKYQAKQVPIKEILQPISGNSGLTEEYLYSLMLSKKDNKYKIVTGSIDIENTQRIYHCQHPKQSLNKITVCSGEGIHVVRKGINAGYINYLLDDNYTLNDDTYILIKKDDCDYDLSLKWFIYTHRHLFMEYASKTDNGTWNKTGFFNYTSIDIPSIIEQNNIVKRFEQLEVYENELMNVKNRIINVLNKELIDVKKS